MLLPSRALEHYTFGEVRTVLKVNNERERSKILTENSKIEQVLFQYSDLVGNYTIVLVLFRASCLHQKLLN